MTVLAVDPARSVGPAGLAVRDLGRHSPRDLARWVGQVHRLRGCREPVRLTGETATLDVHTGEVLRRYTTEDEPHGQLMVRCKNRRASRCPACADEYRGDTFHLIRAGLAGGKGVPETVRAHPRVLATLTAPSFGPVHLSVPGPDGRPRPCYPRRTGPAACWARHASDDPVLGQPIDPAGYDYTAQVLWNAHAGHLWRRFTTYLPRHLAKTAGLTVRDLTEQVRVSYAKVAEYQRRGVVHFHAVIRLDTRTDTAGLYEPPPAWVTLELLEAAIRAAAVAVHLEVTAPTLGRTVRLGWGDQVDVRPIAAFGDGEPVTEEAVAGYIAKYATKATETTGALDRRVTAYDVATLHRREIPAHTARLIRVCWQLGDPVRHPDLADLKLRRWCHMLGFRGHFTTKSRAYSTTLGQLRQARADHIQRDDPDPDNPGPGDPHDLDTTLVLAHWRYAGQGYTPGESLLAASVTGPASDPRFHPRGDPT